MRQPGPVPDGVNRQYDRRALAAVFPGRPVLASFALRTRQEKDIGSAIQNIAALAAAGYQVDAAQVTAETGYEVALKDASTPAQPPLFAPNSKPRALDKAAASEDDEKKDPASLIEEALALAMAQAVADEIGNDAKAKNIEDAQGNEHDELGKFASKPGGGKKPSHNDPSADKADSSEDSGPSDESAEAATRIKVGSVNTDSPEEQKKQIAKAAAAFEKCLSEQTDVPNAFHRSDLGNIDLRWGKSQKGLRHMIERRDAFAKAHPGEPDGKAILAKMPETIIRGKVTEITYSGGHPNIVIEHGPYRAIITRDREGGNHWFISGYEISDKGRGYRAKRK